MTPPADLPLPPALVSSPIPAPALASALSHALPPASPDDDTVAYRALLRAAVGLRTAALRDGAVPALLRLVVDPEAFALVGAMQRAHCALTGRGVPPALTLLAMPVECDPMLTRELVVRYPRGVEANRALRGRTLAHEQRAPRPTALA